jgi:hypothetical protein
MTICTHESIDWLCIVHANFFEYVMCIIYLANESHLFGLLDLKSKEECENSHHGHLKPIGHDLTKLITK